MNLGSPRTGPTRSSRPVGAALIGLSAALVGGALPGCADDEPPRQTADQSSSESTEPPARVLPEVLPELEAPVPRVTDLETVEEMTESCANRLIEWGDKLRKRQYRFAADSLSEDFLGHDLARAGEPEVQEHELGIRRSSWESPKPPVVDKDSFIESLRDFLSPLASLDVVLPKTKGAEFSLGIPAWGKLKVQLRVYGRDARGGRVARVAWAKVRMVQQKGSWLIDRWQLVSLDELRRDQPLFTEVGVPAGVAFRDARFGKDGNDSFFWNGAACEDYDGDGLFDLFVCSNRRNFLYRNEGDGTFSEQAEAAGVRGKGGGTGALFFDMDGDGDLDLFVGHVGWLEGNARVGTTSVLYRNEGDGRFEDVSAAAGLDALLVAFSATAADVDDDGDLDLYVAGYNTEGFTAPNSWHQASNGTPNALYINQGDGRFVDEAAARGCVDNRWSYAATFADFDEDGDQDLYVANDYSANALYVNDGRGHFEDRSVEFGVDDVGNGMGACWGDANGDGRLDLYVSNMSSSAGNRILSRMVSADDGDLERTLYKLAAGNSLFQWSGDGFQRVPPSQGGIGANWAWSSQWFDIELDGDDDLVCVNGFISGDSGGGFKDT